MSNGTDLPEDLWQARSLADTQTLYADWAADYDADMGATGYATPVRLALALRQAGANVAKPVLDYGCGTGLCGLALKSVGFDVVDGTDISPQMLAQAEAKGAYRQVWLSQVGSMGHIHAGDYPILTACGVVSLGAAPAEVLDMLVGALGPAGLLAFSYNDATLQDASYMDTLNRILTSGQVEKVFEDYGPHLPAKNMQSMVYVLQKT